MSLDTCCAALRTGHSPARPAGSGFLLHSGVPGPRSCPPVLTPGLAPRSCPPARDLHRPAATPAGKKGLRRLRFRPAALIPDRECPAGPALVPAVTGAVEPTAPDLPPPRARPAPAGGFQRRFTALPPPGRPAPPFIRITNRPFCPPSRPACRGPASRPCARPWAAPCFLMPRRGNPDCFRRLSVRRFQTACPPVLGTCRR